ncbi:MAG: hypothetical protein AAFY60_20535, partial [Myxococcota bacterium]
SSRFIDIQGSHSASNAIFFDQINKSLIKNVTAALPADGFALSANELVDTRVESVMAYGAGSGVSGSIGAQITSASDVVFDLFGVYNAESSLVIDGIENSSFTTSFITDVSTPLIGRCTLLNPGVLPGIGLNCALAPPSSASFLAGDSSDGLLVSGSSFSESSVADWFAFESRLVAAAQGTQGAGPCAGAGTCETVSLVAGPASAIAGQSPNPTAIVPVTQVWGSATSQDECTSLVSDSTFTLGDCQTRYLPFTGERPDDASSNRNGLCDIETSCQYYPNIGYWQGAPEGTSTSVGTVDFDGRSVELFVYDTFVNR